MMPSGVRKAYGAMIWEQIARHKPASVHLQGTAYVRFTVTASGEIETISIIQSSGSMDLDTLALRTIRRAAPFDPPPASLTSRDLVFEVPFNFL
jgi:protein TonB